jgi:hypothetical protein
MRIANGFVDLVSTTSRDIALSSLACPAPARQQCSACATYLPASRWHDQCYSVTPQDPILPNSTIATLDSSPALSWHPAPHGWRRWLFAANHKDIGALFSCSCSGCFWSAESWRLLFAQSSSSPFSVQKPNGADGFEWIIAARLRIIRSNRRHPCSGRVG